MMRSLVACPSLWQLMAAVELPSPLSFQPEIVQLFSAYKKLSAAMTMGAAQLAGLAAHEPISGSIAAAPVEPDDGCGAGVDGAGPAGCWVLDGAGAGD